MGAGGAREAKKKQNCKTGSENNASSTKTKTEIPQEIVPPHAIKNGRKKSHRLMDFCCGARSTGDPS